MDTTLQTKTRAFKTRCLQALCHGLWLALLCALAPSAWAQSAGRVLLAVGDTAVLRADGRVPLRVGDEVRAGDVLVTGPGAALQVRLADASMLAVRSGSRLRVQDFRFEGKAESDRSVLQLLSGGLRTITGLIGKQNPNNVQMVTPTSTIGIRGTHFAVLHCADDCVDPAVGSAVANGTYGGVTDGRIGVVNRGGDITFAQQEFFYVRDADTPAERLIGPPAFLADRSALPPPRPAQPRPNPLAGLEADRIGLAKATAITPQPPELGTLATEVAGGVVVDNDDDLVTGLAAGGPGAAPGAVSTGSLARVFYSSDDTTVTSGASVQDFASVRATSTSDLTLDAVFVDTNWNSANTFNAVANAGVSRGGNAAAGVYWFYKTDLTNEPEVYHYAFGTAPTVALPTSGLATYNFLGSTTPTDNLQRTGSFSGASLLMNFGAQTVTTLGAMTVAFPSGGSYGAVTYTLPSGTSYNLTGSSVLTPTCTGCSGAPAPSPTWSTAGQFTGELANGYAATIGIAAQVPGITAGTVDHAAGVAAGWAR